jgi:methionyl-tRNA formyltransferase
MRIAFLGNDPWSVPPLEALAHDPDSEVALVLTNPPRPAGRGSRLTPTAVAEAATGLGLPLAEVAGVRAGDGLEALKTVRPEILVVVAYGELLTSQVLTLPPNGAINLHLSLLPRWRGASPVHHAILEGDHVTGVSVMQMDEGLDTGPVLTRREEPVRDDDDTGTLGTRLAAIGGTLLVETLGRIAHGDADPHAQDAAAATFAPKLRPQDRVIDWTREAGAVDRRVRALAPEPGATTTFRAAGLKILRGAPVGGGSGDPGTILADNPDGVAIATGEGTYRLDEVAAAGRRRMSAVEWARGARLRPGERLG